MQLLLLVIIWHFPDRSNVDITFDKFLFVLTLAVASLRYSLLQMGALPQCVSERPPKLSEPIMCEVKFYKGSPFSHRHLALWWYNA